MKNKLLISVLPIFFPRHFIKDGPSVFAQSFALRPVPQLMPKPRARDGPELGYGPVLDRSDEYRPPVYHSEPQESFAKRGGSVGYGGIYPNNGRGGRPSGGPPSDDGYGYGGEYSNKPPRSGNDDEDSNDYGNEYDEPSNGAAPGGRQKGGSNYGGNSEGNNYDYGDPVQNGGYHFSGQTQEGGDEHGRNSGQNQYGSGDDSGGYPYGPDGEDGGNHQYGAEGGDSDSDNHIYGSGNSNSGREQGGERGSGFNSDSGSSNSGGAGGVDPDGFDGFY